jgi:hypothetical protein
MQQRTWELQERTRRFAAAVDALCDRLPADPSAQRTAKKLRTAAKAVMVGYKDVSASPSPEKFIVGISVVASQAKRARASVQMLLQLNHVTIEAARDVLLEARALEAIFRRSRETAKKRRRARLAAPDPKQSRVRALVNHLLAGPDGRFDE